MKISFLSLPFSLPTLVLAATTLVPVSALAWGAQGHRLVAHVAETRLAPAAKTEIDRLLAGEPDPTLHAIAAWADELRSNDPDLGKRSAGWHYVNIAEDNCHYEAPKHCSNGNCVVEAINAQSAILADRSKPDAERAQALKFVVHFVGDLHQPMHAGHGHDKGGNDFQLQYNGRGTNLHALWDGGMLYAQQLSDDQYLQRLLALPAPQLPVRFELPQAPRAWSEDSCRIAISPGVYPHTRNVTDAYASQFLPLAETQMRLAGERLGTLLNKLLADTPVKPSR